jgi:hypothetical protein
VIFLVVNIQHFAKKNLEKEYFVVDSIFEKCCQKEMKLARSHIWVACNDAILGFQDQYPTWMKISNI